LTEALARKTPSIAFTGGGTGGHIYPGLAMIQALRAQGFEGRIFWIGSSKELDKSIVEKEGIEYLAIPSGKLRRSLSLQNLADAFKVIFGYFAARRILARERPSLLVSKGGYVSVPPCRAAASLGIPYITHESDTSPGLATRLNAAGAEKILVSWPDTIQLFPASLRNKVMVVGNPVRPSLFSGSPEKGRAFLGAPEAMPVIAFFGGSQGSRQINDLVAALLPSLAGKAFVFHQTGRDLFDAKIHKADAGRYLPLPYIGDEMRDILAASALVAGRAGAGTVWECLAMEKPMILIPLSGSGTRGDQVENARMAEKAGAAVCLEGGDATPEKLRAAVARFLDSADQYEKARDACRRLSMVERRSGTCVASADLIAGFIIERIAYTAGGTQ